jgi:hypothetical protein
MDGFNFRLVWSGELWRGKAGTLRGAKRDASFTSPELEVPFFQQLALAEWGTHKAKPLIGEKKRVENENEHEHEDD